MVLALLLTPLVPVPQAFPHTVFEIMTGLITEAVMALFLAFTVRMFLTSVQMAGQFISFQMGLAMANTVDPETGIQNTVLS